MNSDKGGKSEKKGKLLETQKSHDQNLVDALAGKYIYDPEALIIIDY